MRTIKLHLLVLSVCALSVIMLPSISHATPYTFGDKIVSYDATGTVKITSWAEDLGGLYYNYFYAIDNQSAVTLNWFEVMIDWTGLSYYNRVIDWGPIFPDNYFVTDVTPDAWQLVSGETSTLYQSRFLNPPEVGGRWIAGTGTTALDPGTIFQGYNIVVPIPVFGYIDNIYSPPDFHVPEPSTIFLFGAGLAGTGLLRRKLRA